MVKNVKVQVIGPLKDQIGVEEANYDGETIKDILKQFVEDYREKIPRYIDEKTGLLKFVMIILNKQHYLMLKNKLDTVLQPNDVIKLALPVGGG